MKRFITNLMIVLIIPSIFLGGFLIFVQLYPGYVDAYYIRVCTKKQKSLIIGTSLAAQGIEPDIINEKLGHIYNTPIFNYSFSLDKSPFGEIYLESIKKKLYNDVKNGLYIIDVEPDAIATLEKLGDINGQDIRESGKCLTINNVSSINTNINIEYLVSPIYFERMDCLKNILRKLGFNKQTSNYFYVKKNGRLCVNSQIDTIKSKEESIKRNNSIKEWYTDAYLSRYRDSCLCETIEYLSKHGTVILISMPTSKELVELQDYYFPDFNDRIYEISSIYQIPYFSFRYSFNKYQTRDGSHLDKNSGDRFTYDLCDSILNYYQ